MDFHFLWLTTVSEFKLWKQALHSFPYPIQHLYYKQENEEHYPALAKRITLCIWSEKEYASTSEKIRAQLKQYRGQNLLLIKNEEFAVKGFEIGIHLCVHQKYIVKNFESLLIELLAYNFEPKRKPLFLKNKILLLTNVENNSIEFIPFQETLYISKQKNETLIKSSTQEIFTTFPFLWIWAQCQNDPFFYKVSDNRIINTLHIKWVNLSNNNKAICLLRNKEILSLNEVEYKKLKDFDPRKAHPN